MIEKIIFVVRRLLFLKNGWICPKTVFHGFLEKSAIFEKIVV